MHFRIYTKPGCPFCTQAKRLIVDKGHTYVEENHDTPEKVMEFKATGYATFPQIFLDEVRIGGYDDLVLWFDDTDPDNF